MGWVEAGHIRVSALSLEKFVSVKQGDHPNVAAGVLDTTPSLPKHTNFGEVSQQKRERREAPNSSRQTSLSITSVVGQAPIVLLEKVSDMMIMMMATTARRSHGQSCFIYSVKLLLQAG